MASKRDGMSGNDRYVTVFSLFSALWESQDSQGMGVKLGRGLELCPGGPLSSVGLLILGHRSMLAQKLGTRVL